MSLIERLEAAEVGSRELDARVWSALFDLDCEFHELVVTTCYDGVDREVHRSSSGSTWVETFDPPMLEFTTSLDAALALAERTIGGVYTLTNDFGGYNNAEVSLTSGHTFMAVAETMPLALCIAILKAKKTK